jgi:hypothetical protein
MQYFCWKCSVFLKKRSFPKGIISFIAKKSALL